MRGSGSLVACLAFATTPTNMREAKAVAARTVRIVAGDEDPPKGADMAAEDVRRSMRALDGHRVSVQVGEWEKNVTIPTEVSPADRWERTELRVQPIRVGGLDATAKLASRSENVAFTVTVPTEEHARLLGANLYRDVDVELRVCRGEGDTIKAGVVLDVHALDASDPLGSWRAWFKENAGEWQDVGNILVELGRNNN